MQLNEEERQYLLSKIYNMRNFSIKAMEKSGKIDITDELLLDTFGNTLWAYSTMFKYRVKLALHPLVYILKEQLTLLLIKIRGY